MPESASLAITEPASVDRRGAIVVVPTYCEAEALPHFVDRFAPTGLQLLVVDDASPDGTGQLADALAADRPWMHVLHRAGKDVAMTARERRGAVALDAFAVEDRRWHFHAVTRRHPDALELVVVAVEAAGNQHGMHRTDLLALTGKPAEAGTPAE